MGKLAGSGGVKAPGAAHVGEGNTSLQAESQAVAWEMKSAEDLPGGPGLQQGPPLEDSTWKQREKLGEDQIRLGCGIRSPR